MGEEIKNESAKKTVQFCADWDIQLWFDELCAAPAGSRTAAAPPAGSKTS
jgi:hypothetical protein